MVVKETADTTPVGLVKLAREAMEECNGDRDSAVALLWTWVRADQGLFARLIEPMIEDGFYDAVRRVDKTTRDHLRLVVRDDVRPTTNLVRSAAGIVAMVERTMYDFPLPGGKRLGDATPADLLHAADYYRKQEKSANREARWYELIHEAMHGGSCVEKVLPNDALTRLRQRAEEEV